MGWLVLENELEGALDAALLKRPLDGVPFPKRLVPEEELEGMVGPPNDGSNGAVAANILASLSGSYEIKVYSQD